MPTRSTVALRNAAIRAVALSCGESITPADWLCNLRVRDYRETPAGMAFLCLSPTMFSPLTLPASKALDRYMARREMSGGIKPPASSPLFLTDCSTMRPRAMTADEIARVVDPTAGRRHG